MLTLGYMNIQLLQKLCHVLLRHTRCPPAKEYLNLTCLMNWTIEPADSPNYQPDSPSKMMGCTLLKTWIHPNTQFSAVLIFRQSKKNAVLIFRQSKKNIPLLPIYIYHWHGYDMAVHRYISSCIHAVVLFSARPNHKWLITIKSLNNQLSHVTWT